jgi:inorganic pyrophosphatase
MVGGMQQSFVPDPHDRLVQTMNLQSLPPFAGKDVFHVVVESPRGSTVKLKYLTEFEAMGISRPLPAGLVFPFESGFVPSTRNADGDPLDVFVVWDVSSFPGVVLTCRPLGVLRIEQNAVNFDASRRIRNDRVIALPIETRREADWQTLDNVPERVRQEWVQFTIAAAALDGKDATAVEWGGSDDALSLITTAADAHLTTTRPSSR